MGIKFFFTFPTSEGSDLLSSHVMQTLTFISKLSDGNVIFRLDVGKNKFYNEQKQIFITNKTSHSHSKVNKSTTLIFKSNFNTFQASVKCLVLPTIT
jgi:hypothetical protein